MKSKYSEHVFVMIYSTGWTSNADWSKWEVVDEMFNEKLREWLTFKPKLRLITDEQGSKNANQNNPNAPRIWQY